MFKCTICLFQFCLLITIENLYFKLILDKKCKNNLKNNHPGAVGSIVG